MKLEEITEFINIVKYKTVLNLTDNNWTFIIIN